MENLTVAVKNPTGLHARPATELVRILKGFTAEATLAKGKKSANPKSLVKLLQIGIVEGDILDLTFDGSDETAARDAAEAFFHRLNEETGEGGKK